MRHNQAAHTPAPQGIIYVFLRGRIQRAGGLVQNEHGRIAHQRAGDFQPLTLAAAEIHAGFLDPGGIALRPAKNFVVDAGIPRRGDDGFVRYGRVPQGDVVAQGSGEKHHVLIHHGNGSPQYFLGNLMPRMAIEQDFAGPGLIDARNQARQGGFAGTAGADHGHPAPRPDYQVEVLDQRRPGLVVAEGDLPQFDAACKLQSAIERGDRLGLGTAAGENGIFLRPGDVFQPLHVRLERLALVREFQEAPDRRQKHLRQNVESDERAQRDVSRHHPGGSDAEDRRGTQRSDEARKRGVEIAQFGIAPARTEFARLLAAPA